MNTMSWYEDFDWPGLIKMCCVFKPICQRLVFLIRTINSLLTVGALNREVGPYLTGNALLSPHSLFFLIKDRRSLVCPLSAELTNWNCLLNIKFKLQTYVRFFNEKPCRIWSLRSETHAYSSQTSVTSIPRSSNKQRTLKYLKYLILKYLKFFLVSYQSSGKINIVGFVWWLILLKKNE